MRIKIETIERTQAVIMHAAVDAGQKLLARLQELRREKALLESNRGLLNATYPHRFRELVEEHNQESQVLYEDLETYIDNMLTVITGLGPDCEDLRADIERCCAALQGTKAELEVLVSEEILH